MLKVAVATILAAMLVACGSTEVVKPTMNVSVGKQLIDLKKAKDSGALSEREFEHQKADLIRNVD